MKTLYILRHAKSSWSDPDQDDFDRPLNERGQKDAPKMGKRLSKMGVHPDLICSSPAVRASTTARLVADHLDRSGKIREDPKLYHAGEETILELVRSFTDKLDAAMVVGHNPGLTEFANELLNGGINNIPTTGIVGVKLKVNSWKETAWGCGELIFFEYPKKEK